MAWYGVGVELDRRCSCRSWSLVHVTLTAALALLLAMGNLFYRDVKYLFDIVLSVAMFATSVVYPVDRIGGTLGTDPGAQSRDHDHRRLPVGAPQRHAAPGGTVCSPRPSLSALLLMTAWALFHRGELAFAENI